MTKFDYLYMRLANAVFDSFNRNRKYFLPYSGTTITFSLSKLVDGFDVQFDFTLGPDASIDEISTSNFFTHSRYKAKFTCYTLRKPSASSLEFLRILSIALPRIMQDTRLRYQALCDQVNLLLEFYY